MKQFFDIIYPYGNSPSKYHHLFNRDPLQIGNIEVLGYISSIWVDEHIENLENNQWTCLWSNVKFQGVNDTKALSRVIGTKFMHINRCRD